MRFGRMSRLLPHVYRTDSLPHAQNVAASRDQVQLIALQVGLSLTHRLNLGLMPLFVVQSMADQRARGTQ